MNIERSRFFERDLAKLKDASIRKQVEKTITLLSSNPYHPSLRNKHIVCKDADNLYSIRVNQNYRILYLKWDEAYELYRLLDHDKYDRLVKGC